MTTPQYYRPEIDGLRALAVVPVVLFHAGLGFASGGFVGVDIFFVISGYLITTIILKELQQGRFSLFRFYERRARRILPALTVVILFCIPLSWVVMTPAQLETFSQSLVSVVFYLSNVYFWMTRDYFSEASELLPLLHTWSLAVEEQFYFLFPLLMISLRRSKRATLLVLLFSFIAMSLALSEYASYRYQEFNFYMLPTRAWELLVGSFIAGISHGKSNGFCRSRWTIETLSTLGFLLISFSIVFFDNATPFPGLRAAFPVLGAALIILFANPSTYIGRILSSRVFVRVGVLSYSIYLWHQPLFAFYRIYFGGHPNRLSIIFLVLATLILSHLTWRYIERPFRNGKTVTLSKLVPSIVISSVVLVAFGLAGHINNGFGGRFHTQALALAETAEASPMRNDCHTSGEDYLSPKNACVYGSGSVEWAVLGDSHAVELAYALSQQLQPRGEALKHLTFSSCGPEIGYTTTLSGCSSWIEEALGEIERDPQLKNIVISYYHLHHEKVFKGVDDPTTNRNLYYDGLEAILNRLLASGKNVTVVLPIPHFVADVRDAVFPRHIFESSLVGEEIYVDKDSFTEESAYARERIFRFVREMSVNYIDPVNAFCRKGVCVSQLDNYLLYFDSHHVSIHGAERIVKLFEFKDEI